jgi:hypothetical protein
VHGFESRGGELEASQRNLLASVQAVLISVKLARCMLYVRAAETLLLEEHLSLRMWK